MIKLEIHGAMCEVHGEGNTSTIETEALAASIAIIRMFAKAKHLSFEAASLLLMQKSNKWNSMAEELKLGD